MIVLGLEARSPAPSPGALQKSHMREEQGDREGEPEERWEAHVH